MFVSGGIAVFSLYLDCDDPLGLNSFQIPNRLGEELHGWQLPFVIRGDFNTSPKLLADSGWVDKIGGTIFHTSEPT
eukprot:1647311-Pyramimonas_sp.AAC.1